jgi:hypothetical protein
MSEPTPTIDLGYPTEARGRIPSFNSIEEEAEWWDTHDSADYDDKVVPVEVTIGLDFTSVLRVPLEDRDISDLGRRANVLGVGITELARMWIEERLHKEMS